MRAASARIRAGCGAWEQEPGAPPSNGRSSHPHCTAPESTRFLIVSFWKPSTPLVGPIARRCPLRAAQTRRRFIALRVAGIAAPLSRYAMSTAAIQCHRPLWLGAPLGYEFGASVAQVPSQKACSASVPVTNSRALGPWPCHAEANDDMGLALLYRTRYSSFVHSTEYICAEDVAIQDSPTVGDPLSVEALENEPGSAVGTHGSTRPGATSSALSGTAAVT